MSRRSVPSGSADPAWTPVDPLPSSTPGPRLVAVLVRLRDTPPLLASPQLAVDAIVADSLDLLAPRSLDQVAAAMAAAVPATATQWPGPASRVAAAVASWLLTGPEVAQAVRDTSPDPETARAVARRAIVRMSTYVQVLPLDRWMAGDEDRQEEICRAFLRAAGLRPADESHDQAEDRFTSISTTSRAEALRQAVAREQWEAEVARKLAEEKAKEAAAQYASY